MQRTRGFGLVEVLVTLIVISVGLLGIAKLQALAFSSIGVASMRSLAALEASSLAAAMHADRAYWAAGGVVPAVITVTGTTISDGTLATAADCTTASGPNPPNCSTTTLAAYDLQQWAQSVNVLLPNPVSTITCTNVVGTPVSCTVQITWAEKAVAVNQQGTNGAAMLAPTYVLYVQP
ncbi:MAG: type IV pilus modification protein PilV [Steroidobacteraceae bacterium]